MSRHGSWYVAGICGLLVAVSASAGPFAQGHMFVSNGTWQNGDILEYDAAGAFVRSFKSTLPAGYQLDGIGALRWGPDGLLYTYGNLKTAATDWTAGVMAWDGNGGLSTFYPRNPPGLNTQGFAVAANGDFYIVDGGEPNQKVKQVDRAFTSFTPFSLGAFAAYQQGDQGAYLHGGALWVVGASVLARYDVGTHELVQSIFTSRDNSDLAVSTDGRTALNDQWTGYYLSDTTPAIVDVYNQDGNLIGSAEMPQTHWTALGIGFNADGLLYVASWHDPTVNDNGTPGDANDDYLSNWHSGLTIFDANLQYLGTFASLEMADITGVAFTPVPEPATTCMLVVGGLAALRRRR